MSQKPWNILFTTTVRWDLIFVKLEPWFFTKIMWHSFVFPWTLVWFSDFLVRTHATTLFLVLNCINYLAIISFSLYSAVFPSFICWDKLTKLIRSFCPALPITSLILKSFVNNVLWLQISKLSDGRHICHTCNRCMSTCVALPTSYWFCCCWAVLLPCATSCGACCSCWLVQAVFFAAR